MNLYSLIGRAPPFFRVKKGKIGDLPDLDLDLFRLAGCLALKLI